MGSWDGDVREHQTLAPAATRGPAFGVRAGLQMKLPPTLGTCSGGNYLLHSLHKLAITRG